MEGVCVRAGRQMRRRATVRRRSLTHWLRTNDVVVDRRDERVQILRFWGLRLQLKRCTLVLSFVACRCACKQPFGALESGAHSSRNRAPDVHLYSGCLTTGRGRSSSGFFFSNFSVSVQRFSTAFSGLLPKVLSRCLAG